MATGTEAEMLREPNAHKRNLDVGWPYRSAVKTHNTFQITKSDLFYLWCVEEPVVFNVKQIVYKMLFIYSLKKDTQRSFLLLS